MASRNGYSRVSAVVAIVVLLVLALSLPAAARTSSPPASPDPVVIDAICQERIGPGVAEWKPADMCNRAYQVIVFDGLTPHQFCFAANGHLHSPTRYGTCAVGGSPVVLTGDGSVNVFIGEHGVISRFGPGVPGVI